MSLKRALSPSLDNTEDMTTSTPKTYFSTDTVEDRASTFRAAFTPLPANGSSRTPGPQASRQLQAAPDFNDATHRMTAWRVRGAQKTISGVGLLDLGHDDDGEKWAGVRLEKLLDKERIEGAVCVARWYGGVMLGSVRFTHIEDAAKSAIAVWRDDTEGAKRRKLEADEAKHQKEELVQTLKERDESIHVLRKMLAQKTGAEDATPSPGKVPDYTEMQVAMLQKLERARDSTIAAVLKKIDVVEANTAVKSSQSQAEDSKKTQKVENESIPAD